MRIRPALASDAPAIDQLFQEFVAYLRDLGDKTEYRFGAAQYRKDGFGPDPAFRGLIAEDETGAIGYALFSGSYEGDYVRQLYLVDLFVRREARSRGVGKQLFEAVGEVARKEGITRISWRVFKKNTAALRFYQRLGAVPASDSDQVMYLTLGARVDSRQNVPKEISE